MGEETNFAFGKISGIRPDPQQSIRFRFIPVHTSNASAFMFFFLSIYLFAFFCTVFSVLHHLHVCLNRNRYLRSIACWSVRYCIASYFFCTVLLVLVLHCMFFCTVCICTVLHACIVGHR